MIFGLPIQKKNYFTILFRYFILDNQGNETSKTISVNYP
jgi:hypothetical protein